ncbi:MAG: flagellar biosynthetic protein FliR [Sphingomonadales bacterium 32-68-7]|nr:MAG: flagellar biosynthetic protein FliR [Sphingomonadales bacterium 12-68-11]OYX10168.1 MAG: flagellar biosynthetic protein FliR [Sphingomonadales bacterium 32-68-7]
MIGLDFGFGAVEQELWRLVFAMTRIGAALLAAPFFGAANVPVQLRVAIAGAIAVLVCAWTPLQPPPALLSLDGMLVIAGEVLVGLSLGFILQVMFAAPVIAAEVIGGTMGLSIAVTSDPTSGAQSTALGQYFAIILALIFLSVGGHLEFLALVIDSYRAFPPGETWLGAERLDHIVQFGGAMFVTAAAIALPVTLILLIVQVVTGVLSRSAPSLNLFALGLPAGVLAGIAALIACFPILTSQLTELSRTAVESSGSLLVP